MFQERYYYLVIFQCLDYRFHGWQKQPNTETLHLMIDRTLKYVLKDQYFKTLAASRTDAKVSAEEAAFELFLKDKPLDDLELFMAEFNANLPQDIRALSIDEVTSDFNIIQDSKYKEYHYIFSQGEKCHPSVSYTHLRAHETGRNLVCRLLLEKKKKRKNQQTKQQLSKQ